MVREPRNQKPTRSRAYAKAHTALPYAGSSPLICAHRGLSAQYIGNERAAFKAAINDPKIKMIEFDVRATKDGTLVVYHDAKVHGRRLRNLTLAEARVCIPGLLTLEELVELAAGKIRLCMELKESGHEAQAIETVLKRFSIDKFVVISFRKRVISQIAAFPSVNICTGLLVGDYWRWPWLLRRPSDLRPLRSMQDCGANFVACSLQLVRWGMIERLRRAGVPVAVWTVNEPGYVQQLLGEQAVRIIISDCPKKVLEVI